MTNLIILLTLLVSLNSFGQVTIGIGVVDIEFDSSTVIHFYKTPADRTPSQTIQFFNDKGIDNWNIKDLEKQSAWLKPETLWLDYHFFNFRCKAKKDQWLEVIVNNENGSSFWIKETESCTFLTWEEYLKKMFSIERIQNQKTTD